MQVTLSRSRSSWPLVLGALCVALVLMSGMIQAAHFHANGEPEHGCALCLTAHSVAQVPAPIALHFSSVSVTALAPVPNAPGLRRSVFLRLVSRPPPALPVLFA